jgi:hypothetical protein
MKPKKNKVIKNRNAPTVYPQIEITTPYIMLINGFHTDRTNVHQFHPDYPKIFS